MAENLLSAKTQVRLTGNSRSAGTTGIYSVLHSFVKLPHKRKRPPLILTFYAESTTEPSSAERRLDPTHFSIYTFPNRHHGRQEGSRGSRYVRFYYPSCEVVGCLLPRYPQHNVHYLPAEREEYSRRTDFRVVDYTLNNPDTLTKYKSAAQISQKVLEAVSALCVAGEKIVTICEKGDKLLEEEISKVYRGKKIVKGEFFISCHSGYVQKCSTNTLDQESPTQLLFHHPHSLPHILLFCPMKPKLHELWRKVRLSKSS